MHMKRELYLVVEQVMACYTISHKQLRFLLVFAVELTTTRITVAIIRL